MPRSRVNRPWSTRAHLPCWNIKHHNSNLMWLFKSPPSTSIRTGKLAGSKRAHTWSSSVPLFLPVTYGVHQLSSSCRLDTYGDYGYTSWEFPEMVTREKPLINDSDGRNYPWYGSSHQVVTVNGPLTHPSKYTVTMRDFFHPWCVQDAVWITLMKISSSRVRIPWDIPTSDEEIPRLTHIYRNQHFLVWLAAMDLESKVNALFSP